MAHDKGHERPQAEQPRGAGRPQHGQGAHDGHEMDRAESVAKHHTATQWCWWTIAMLGVWCLVAPFTFGYLDPENWVQPSGGRGAWLSDATHDLLRARLMTGSELISGALLVVLGLRSLVPGRVYAMWGCCFVGAWLTLAPVLFWAPTVASYVSSTLVGMLVMALSVLIPGMPNMMAYMRMGPPTPPGWSYNPSSWAQRSILAVLGLGGFVVSRYLAAYQLGFVAEVWDPVFGDGSRQALDSDLSHSLPVSDSALGAAAYTFELLMAFMGGPARWRTMPWMVTLFGILVIPLGLVHVLLVVSQPVVVGAWCFFCLVAAAFMLPMIPLEFDEVVAMAQHVKQAYRRGDRGTGPRGLWRVFWKGGSAKGCTPDERSPALHELGDWHTVRASVWGASVPGGLALACVLGLALVFVGSYAATDTAADLLRLGGLLVITFSVIAMGEPMRAMRWLNLPLAALVAIGPWIWGEIATAGGVLGTILALLVAAVSVPRGPKQERYGAWDAWVV